MKNKNTIFLGLALLGLTTFAKAQTAGSFNTTFGTNGLVTTDIGFQSNEAYKELIQPDGKIIIIGHNSNGIILRYNTNGTLDTTFNGTGKVFSNNNYFESGALQPDGKIVVCTQQDVRRYNSNGSLDITFGTNGVYAHSSPSGNYFGIRNVAVQTDGKIVFAGYESDASNSNFAAVRLNSNGTIDTSFNGTGKVTKDINQSEAVSSIVLQTDGKIILAGDTQVTGNISNYVAIRYNGNGTLDSTFGTAGVVNINDGSYNKLAEIALQSDGKLVMAGTYSYDIKTIRLNTNGTLDTTFNGTGKVTGNLATDETRSVAIQADGKIVVLGFKYDFAAHTSEYFLLRYNSNGTLDTTFNSTGVVLASINKNKSNRPCTVKIQTDGKIVLSGTSYLTYNNDIAILRFNTNGTLDTTFNETGKVTSGILANGSDDLGKLAVQSDGKILATGYTTTYNLSVVRYNANGSLDTSFNNKGIVTDNFAHPYYTNQPSATAVLSQTNGKVLLIGNYLGNSNTGEIFIRRYNANGSIDNTFGNSGTASLNINSNWTYSNSATLQSDGKIVITGVSRFDTTNNVVTLIRYNSTGTLDTTFNGTGFLNTSISANSEGNTIAVQPDGKILVGGWVTNGANKDLLLIRYNSNGSLDNTFNGTGMITQGLGNGDDVILKIALQSDGKIAVLSSYVNASSSVKLALLRYQSNGSLDTSFNSTGKLLTTYSGSLYLDSNDMVLDPLNRMIVSSNINSLIFRYNINGTLDTTFGDGGNVINRFTAISLLLANNHLITGGNYYSSNYTNSDFGLSSINLYNIGIGGIFNNWGATADVSMSSTDGINFTVSNHTFPATEVKFRENNAWNLNWGGSTFPTGTGLSNGANIAVPAGTYTVKFNIVSGDYSFTKTLGTTDSDKRAAFSFAPNPAKEKIIFNEEIKKVEIYALDGKKLNVTYTDKEANVSTLPKGIYIIKASSGNGDIMSKKLIKE